MAKARENIVERICEGCEDEVAIKKSADLGWLCQECLDSYKNLDEDEVAVKELTDEEINELVDEDENLDEDDDDLSLDEKELRREGFSLDTDEDNDYN